MNNIPCITLKPKRERPLIQRHPWVFSGSLQNTPSLEPGCIVDINSHKGMFMGRGYYNPEPSLCARVLSWNKVDIDYEFIHSRVLNAVSFRKDLGLEQKIDSYRVVSSEADFLPGLIVEKFGNCIVIQITTAGMQSLLPYIEKSLMTVFPDHLIVERSDDPMRQTEGLENRSRIVSGGPANPPIQITENGLKFLTDPLDGQKTGFYLDQRVNRKALTPYVKGKKVLDCFSYTGGFSLHAAAAGAVEILAIDQSEWAIERVKEHFSLNQNSTQGTKLDVRKGDAFEILREMHAEGQKFDVIVMDPPKFIKNRSQIDRGARGYKDVNRLAFHMLNSGGILATFSCSGHMSADLFQKVVFSAAHDAGCNGHILQHLTQAPDHPILLTVPESFYLNGLIIKKT